MKNFILFFFLLMTTVVFAQDELIEDTGDDGEVLNSRTTGASYSEPSQDECNCPQNNSQQEQEDTFSGVIFPPDSVFMIAPAPVQEQPPAPAPVVAPKPPGYVEKLPQGYNDSSYRVIE